jgi:hypothetical protein
MAHARMTRGSRDSERADERDAMVRHVAKLMRRPFPAIASYPRTGSVERTMTPHFPSATARPFRSPSSSPS